MVQINGRGKREDKKKPTAIDLFCGCGGLTLGLKQAGFNVIGAVDIFDNDMMKIIELTI